MSALLEEEPAPVDIRAGVTRAIIRSLQISFKKPAKLFRPSAMSTVHLLRAREGVLKSGARASDMSTWDLAKQSVKRKGVKSTFVRYFIPPLALNMGVGAVTFGMYENSRELLRTRCNWNREASVFCGGMAGGAAHALFNCPIDAMTPYLQKTDRNGNWSLRYSIRLAIREEQWRGLYRGFTLSLLKDMSGFGVFFLVYEQGTKRSLDWLHTRFFNDPHAFFDKRKRMAEVLLVSAAGGFAGVSYQALSYPVHRLKYIMHHSEGPAHTSTLACLRALSRQHGVGLLFQGISWSLVKAFSPSALAFMIYEVMTGDLHERYKSGTLL